MIQNNICMLQGGDTSAGQLPENIGKNRYRDVLPYEVSKSDVG